MDEQMREKLYAAWAESGFDDQYFVIGEAMWNAAIAALSKPAAADELLEAAQAALLCLTGEHDTNGAHQNAMDLLRSAIAKATQ